MIEEEQSKWLDWSFEWTHAINHSIIDLYHLWNYSQYPLTRPDN